jgi:signal transduction histidine kinase
MRALVLAAAIAAGLASGQAAYGWAQPERWIPDLLAGLVLVGAGLYARKAPGALLVATGFAWFAGNLDPALWYWHRGPLIHLLLAFPGWRPETRLGLAAVVSGYLAAVIMPVWNTDLVAVALVTFLLAVRARRTRGQRRRAAARATGAFALALYGGAASRLIFPAGAAVVPELLVYQVVLCGIAVAMAWTIRRPGDDAVTDMVVELARPGSLRVALADALGDPNLQVGFWRDGCYVDERGVPLTISAADHATTSVAGNGEPLAVIVHDRAVLTDPSMVAAAGTATRLTAANAALQREVQAQAAELAASRRRLVMAADEERRHLEERLRNGPVRHLADLLAGLPAGKAAEELSQTLRELDDLAHGLHPRELADGLASALGALAARSPVPVRLSLISERLPPEIEAALYYVCAEALANVAKHAAASAVSMRLLRQAGIRLEVADDGTGGADSSRGTGLRGLRDRVETFGGRLLITSPPGSGTVLAAEIPLDGAPPAVVPESEG